MLYVWIAVIVLAIVAELLTSELIAVWFMPAAIVSLILAACEVAYPIQLIVFFAIAAIGIVLARIFLKDKLKPTVKTNIDAIVGEKCVVTVQIDNYAGRGQAKVKGQIWSARSVCDEDVYEVGEVLHIVAIEGVKLICKK